ncbi:cholecystokinin receptor type A-like isoform X1 [Venturia canescens]|uniref:cholecystokinin receptor type A-like isoform X1 n=2 Tax=Venturia canescens TaxID=32260 RepID=UPI001C9C79A0|nr:cholecystokinin receptor type A-like isoform X1 [Venturia canescens]
MTVMELPARDIGIIGDSHRSNQKSWKASCSMPSVVYVTSKGRKPVTRCSSTSLTSSNREHNRLLITGSVDCQPSSGTIRQNLVENSEATHTPVTTVSSSYVTVDSNEDKDMLSGSKSTGLSTSRSWHDSIGRRTLRRTNPGRALLRKKRIVKMLLVVVLEFFVCWTPLYVINTLALFSPMAVYDGLGSTGISFLQLLAYTSSCCNPITYCFMNDGFRKSFLGLFKRCNCTACPAAGRI